MGKIEERAKLLATECEATNDVFGTGYRKGLEEGYIVGSHKQKAIDVEKACQWLRENAFSWIDDSKINEDTRALKEQKLLELKLSLVMVMEN